MRLFAFLLYVVVLLGEDPTEGAQASATVGASETAGVQAGVIGTRFWRVRAIVGTNGQEWAITHFSLYDSVADDATPLTIPAGECTGNEDPTPEECMIKSSTKMIPKEDPDPGNADVTAANLLPDTPHPIADAFKDGDDTYWMSNTNQKDEFIGVKFTEAIDVKLVKLKVLDLAHCPPSFVIEQSIDGDNWARAGEVTDGKDWDQKITTFSWVPKDKTPSSVFAIRSQKDPSFCIGAKPIPDPEEPDLIAPKPIDYDTALEVQRCGDTIIPQFWYFDESNGRLHNAAGEMYIAQVGAGGANAIETDGSEAPAAGDPLSIGKCTSGCSDDTTNLFGYQEHLQGGFVRLLHEGWNNLVIAAPTSSDGAIIEGAVSIAECGSNGAIPAALNLCSDLVNAQWELSPMFNIEPNKKAVNCSPYSHTNRKPEHCTDQKVAQKTCAKDKQCIAYNWVDGSAEGNDQDKLWTCYELHDVHSKTENDDLTGWELGLRLGFSEDLIEERKRRLAEATEKAALGKSALEVKTLDVL